MLVALFLSAILSAEPDVAPVALPKLIVEADETVAFSEPITIDVSKSEGLVDVKFAVYPRKKIHLDSGGRSAWFMAKPGPYTIFIVASGRDGKMVQEERTAIVQPLSVEEWQELAPPEAAQQMPQRAAARAQAAAPPPSTAPDPFGLREDVEALYKDVRSNSKFTQRARMAVLYDSAAVMVGTDAAPEPGKIVGPMFGELDSATQENWLNFSLKIGKRLESLAGEGRLATPADWATAYRSVAGVLREVR